MSSPITITDALRQAILYQLSTIHTSMPGEIISYDFTTQKANIQPLLNKVWSDGTSTPIPILNNVPVIFPRAGGGSLTFPVVQGDTCLLVFSERSIDNWLAEGGQINPNDPRKFDLSDGVAIMGLFPFSQSSYSDNNTDTLLTYAGSKIRIKESGDIVIETSSKVAIGTSSNELLQIIYDLLSFLSTSITTTVGQPIQGALPATTYSNLLAQINAIKGTIP